MERRNIDDIDKELERLLSLQENGSGYGDPEAKEADDRKIQVLLSLRQQEIIKNKTIDSEFENRSTDIAPLLRSSQPLAPDLAEVGKPPFLSQSDISNAHKMSELYIILHCYENSVRQLVEKVLVQNLGDNWWEQAANPAMKNNVEQLKEKEKKRKWLSVRGKVSPLYYLEWGDLEKLIRKYEDLFKPHIGELRFIESRFGDLESLRHIVAHHGVLPSEDDFQRIKLSFKDWCRQVGDS